MRINVLDKGYVELVNHMGDDYTPAFVAGISFGRESIRDEVRERKLLETLIKSGHESPFEHVAFTFKIKAPIFVARQWMRHRVGSFNEVSMRYVKAKPEFYVPENEKSDVFAAAYDAAYSAYRSLIDAGIKKEQARLVLPFGLYTLFYWTVNLRSLFNFLDLRLHPHAQYEMQLYASAVLKLARTVVPIIMELKGYKEV